MRREGTTGSMGGSFEAVNTSALDRDPESSGSQLEPPGVPSVRPRSWDVADIGLAALLSAFILLLLILPYREHAERLPPLWAVVAIALSSTVPLAFRRRRPGLALVLCGIGYAAYVRMGTGEATVASVAFYIALFSAGAYMADRWRTPLRVVVVVGFLATIATYIVLDRETLGDRFGLLLITAIPFEAAIQAGAWLMGDWFRDRELYARELDRRATELERNRLERERRVVRDERVRIARELHDVVAHHVSVMGIEAGAARTVLASSPERVATLLTTIEQTSRRAVEEMHRLLSALREDTDPRSADRMPNLRELGELMDAAKGTGLEVDLEIRGEARLDLSETVDLSAYRIVQEALTNVIRHAHATHVQVIVTYSPEALDLRIEDDGHGYRSRISRGGRGLVGMRERAALFGGTLAAGPRPDGGFVVDVHLPIPA
jgi:signal transduction histidine kinase